MAHKKQHFALDRFLKTRGGTDMETTRTSLSTALKADALLEAKADGYHYAGSSLLYRITGLLPYNLERLRVTVRATLPVLYGRIDFERRS